jgi:hypothetical protein
MGSQASQPRRRQIHANRACRSRADRAFHAGILSGLPAVDSVVVAVADADADAARAGVAEVRR